MMSSAPLPSNRSFGTLFVVVFAIVGAYVWWRGAGAFGWWFGLSGLTLAVTLAKPDWLTPANRAWMKLAEILNRIVSPVVLGVIFFGMFAPIGWAMRRAGRDALKRRFEPAARSYWVDRTPPGPDPAGLPNQF
jgi:Saxitoxin biosynthesis operon protein SxtJ